MGETSVRGAGRVLWRAGGLLHVLKSAGRRTQYVRRRNLYGGDSGAWHRLPTWLRRRIQIFQIFRVKSSQYSSTAAVYMSCPFVVVQTLVDTCEQYVSEHRDYDSGCQLARDWLTASRDRVDTCVNVCGDRQRLEAAQNTLAVTTDSLLLVVVREGSKLFSRIFWFVQLVYKNCY